MDLNGKTGIEQALGLLGELMAARGERLRIVVIGGAAMNLLGFVSRATTDVDILAFGAPDGAASDGAPIIVEPPAPLPDWLVRDIQIVAQDAGLDRLWLNCGPAGQWKQGLPPGLATRIEWRAFGPLAVGLVGRIDLIYFKLYAAADQTGPESVHFQDLLALRPQAAELLAAEVWVRQQDPSPGFVDVLRKVAIHAERLAQ
jgi:hypothetical protein